MGVFIVILIIISIGIGIGIGAYFAQYLAANQVIKNSSVHVRETLGEIHEKHNTTRKYLDSDDFVTLFNELYYGDTVKIDDSNRAIFAYRAMEEFAEKVKKAPWLFRTYFKHKG